MFSSGVWCVCVCVDWLVGLYRESLGGWLCLWWEDNWLDCQRQPWCGHFLFLHSYHDVQCAVPVSVEEKTKTKKKARSVGYCGNVSLFCYRQCDCSDWKPLYFKNTQSFFLLYIYICVYVCLYRKRNNKCLFFISFTACLNIDVCLLLLLPWFILWNEWYLICFCYWMLRTKIIAVQWSSMLEVGFCKGAYLCDHLDG